MPPGLILSQARRVPWSTPPMPQSSSAGAFMAPCSSLPPRDRSYGAQRISYTNSSRRRGRESQDRERIGR
jgi:hypothetical protein